MGLAGRFNAVAGNSPQMRRPRAGSAACQRSSSADGTRWDAGTRGFQASLASCGAAAAAVSPPSSYSASYSQMPSSSVAGPHEIEIAP